MDANEYEKLSKKEKRDLYLGKRTGWVRFERSALIFSVSAPDVITDSILCFRFCLAVFERGHTQSLDFVREQGISS